MITRARRPASIALVALLLTLLAFASPAVTAPVKAQMIALVQPAPATLQLATGEIATVEIRVENAHNLYGIDVRGAFDPAVIEIVDANPTADGVQLVPGAFPQPDFVALNAADNTAGAFRFAVTQVNPTAPATGSGVIFSFQVRGLGGGVTDIAIELVEMSDRDGMLLAVTTGSAAVEVAGAPAAATPTRIILGPTAAPPSGSAATPTATSPAAPAAEAPPNPTQQPESQPPAAATTTAATTAATLPPTGDSAPASPSTASDPAVPTSGLAIETTDSAAATDVDLSAPGDSAAPEGQSATGGPVAPASIADSSDGSASDAPAPAAPLPAVIGDSAVPGAMATTTPPAGDGAGNRSAVPAAIGGVIALGLAGFLLARMRKRG